MKTNIFNITALALLFTSSFIIGKKSMHTEAFELPSITTTEVVEMSNTSYAMVEAKIVDGEVIPMVELPELTITADYNSDNMVRAEQVNGEIIPVVYLPELEIVAQR